MFKTGDPMKAFFQVTAILLTIAMSPVTVFAAQNCSAQIDAAKSPLVADDSDDSSLDIGNVEFSVTTMGTSSVATIIVKGPLPQPVASASFAPGSVPNVNLFLNGHQYSIDCN